MREQLFEHRLTNAASEQEGLTKIDEAGDADMELASDEEGGQVFDMNDLDNEARL